AVVNTDTKTLSASPIQEKLLIGRSLTRGMSAGGEADIGRRAAEGDEELIAKLVNGVDLVFLLAGLGGGTGSGAAPVLAREAEKAGAVVLAFVTMPFTREGERRRQQADEALAELRESCHAVIALPNDMILQQVDEKATVLEAFAVADEWVSQGVKAIWSMLFQSGLMNVDFATLRNAFRFRGGKTLFGIGRGQGEDCVQKALADLELCPLLHLPDYKYANKADSLIIHICGGPGMAMSHVNQIMDAVCDKFGSRQNTVIGAVLDGGMRDEIQITVIGATEVNASASNVAQAARVAAQRRRMAAAASGVGAVRRPLPDAPASDLSRLPSKASAAARKAAQDEFDFKVNEDRGFFEKTEANLYQGEDLDVPTFLRRGIRIQL
ncbi:MAG: cell division FtsZ family protein, partial [Opitutales bacterium]|nr:cell division FtsZ family protein [Opitutales bacterium]